jgi:hypothetical protein
MSIKSCAMAVAVIVGTLGLVGTADAQLIRRGSVYYTTSLGYYPSTVYTYPSSGVVYTSAFDPSYSSGVVVASGAAPYATEYYSPAVYNAGYYGSYYSSPYYSSYYSPYNGNYYNGWGRRVRW